MLFNDSISLLLIILNLIVAEHHSVVTNIISVSSVLGTQLLFNAEVLDKLTDNKDSKTIIWYKGIINLKSLINSHDLSTSNQSRYHLINQTKLLIPKTLIGDEGFYTLKIQTESNIYKQYLFHVILFTQNLSLFISPPSNQQIPYHAEQKINCTCSITFFTDRIYIEKSRSLFFSTWYMIIYNNDPDYYQLISSSSSNSYTYIAYLLNYELNRNDHNQTISCSFIQQKSQQFIIHNVTLPNQLNILYKTYLRGNYYFTRSFNTYSSIEINCEEFDANPKPIYTLIWTLNGENKILLNKTKYGRYFINNATWRHRGNYTCLAENYLNNNHSVHQSFRLNIWFNEHKLKDEKLFSLQKYSQMNLNKSIILIVLIFIFIFACFSFSLSFYCFCLQKKIK